MSSHGKEIDPEITLDIFKSDINFRENQRRYEEVKKTVLGDESMDEEGSDASSDYEEDDDDDEDKNEEKGKEKMERENLRIAIFLKLMYCLGNMQDCDELLKIKLKPGKEMEVCNVLLESLHQERTYLTNYGLLGEGLCAINKVYQENFEKCFFRQYSIIHRLEMNELCNVVKFFAHLLDTDAIPWHVLACIRLTEEDTTSSSRIFVQILFQLLSDILGGVHRLNERLKDPTMQQSCNSIFPKDNPKNIRFSIDFFTSIGLARITENLRIYATTYYAVSASESDGNAGSNDS